MLCSSLSACVGLVTALIVPTAVRVAHAERAFHAPEFYAFSPSSEPGGDPYCKIRIRVIDASTSTSTPCFAGFGPCSGNSGPKPEMPLDADHPAACYNKDFSFYFDRYESIYNYSVAFSVSDGERRHFGVSAFINQENFRPGWGVNCGGSGVCQTWLFDEEHPVIIPFEKG